MIPKGCVVQRQAFAGMFWSKQYYHFVVEDWLKGDPGCLRRRRNAGGGAILNGVICSMKTSFLCRISGSIHGTRHGIWHFILHGDRT